MGTQSCEHLWQYEVEVSTQAVRRARCLRCGLCRPLQGAVGQPSRQVA